jgi:hypothetical protein
MNLKALWALVILLVPVGLPAISSAILRPNLTLPELTFLRDSPSPNGQGSLRPNTRPARYLDLIAKGGSTRIGLVALNSGVRPNTVDVMVGLDQPAPNTSYFAKIYFGTCASPREVAYDLEQVKNGRSDSTLPLYYERFIDEKGGAYRGPYAILVSRTTNKSTMLFCADLPGQGAPAQNGQDPKPQETRTVKLIGPNGATVVGTAWINAAGPGKTRVTIKVARPSPKADYSAGINLGVCEDPGSEAFKLKSLQHGSSETDLAASLLGSGQPSEANMGNYAIMLYSGSARGGQRLACGTLIAGHENK